MDPTVFDVFSMVFGRFSNGFQRFSVFSCGFLNELALNGFSIIALHFGLCAGGGIISRDISTHVTQK